MKVLLLHISLLLLISLTACAPRPFGLQRAPEGSPPLFRQGFDDGCDTGLASFGNSFYKSFYRFRKDFRFADDATYKNGWDKGYSYCRAYAMKWTFVEWDK